MAQFVKKKFYLTGPLAGKTKSIRGRQFVNGVYEFTGSEADYFSVQNYFGKVYRAYSEDDPRLEEAQNAGKVQAAAAKPGGGKKVVGAVRPGAAAAANERAGHGDPKAGGEGSNPAAGDGHKRPEDLEDERLRAAMLKLDPANDEHWNKYGAPAMAAVEAHYGSTNFTRKQMEAVLPGFNRAKHKEAAKEK